MREAWDPIIQACEALGANALAHVEHYGAGIKDRLTGAHWSEFHYGVSDRGASVRIPWIAAKEAKGWLEDRRPNANMDPYIVTRMIIETCCSALATTTQVDALIASVTD
jgi:glutamine synthetase